MAERRQHRFIKSARDGEVSDREGDMIDHRHPIRANQIRLNMRRSQD